MEYSPNEMSWKNSVFSCMVQSVSLTHDDATDIQDDTQSARWYKIARKFLGRLNLGYIYRN